MKQPIQTEEERTMAMRVETDAAERDRLPNAAIALRKSWPSSGSDAGTKLAGVTAWSFCVAGSSLSGCSWRACSKE